MADAPRAQVTTLLRQVADGKQESRDRLCHVVYEDLKRVAHNLMRGERSNHTLQPTALVNEAMMRLFDGNIFDGIESRAVFFGAASRAMRQVLVDHARQRNAVKRGGLWRRTPLDDAIESLEKDNLDLVEMDRALTKLARLHQRQHEVIQLRFFGGVSVAEIAAMLNVSQSTVEKDLQRARAFLYGELADG